MVICTLPYLNEKNVKVNKRGIPSNSKIVLKSIPNKVQLGQDLTKNKIIKFTKIFLSKSEKKTMQKEEAIT